MLSNASVESVEPGASQTGFNSATAETAEGWFGSVSLAWNQRILLPVGELHQNTARERRFELRLV